MENKVYNDLRYWNERYKNEQSYEWCLEFSSFKDTFIRHVPGKDSRILILGCGNSALGVDLYKHGYSNVVNSDYSKVIIQRMKDANPDQQWEVADINNLLGPYTAGSFDVVIEKATLDSFFVEEKDPWNYSCQLLAQMENILDQVSRILSPSGQFISLSFTQPHFRKPIYAKQRFGWALEYTTYGDFFHYFFYVMKKGEKLNSGEEKRTEKICDILEPLSEDEDNFLFGIQSVH